MNIWVLQTGEPLHIDNGNARPMRAMNLSNALVEAGHNVILWSSGFYHQEKRHRSHLAKIIHTSDQLEIRLIPSMGYKRHIGLGRLVDHAHMAMNLKNMLREVDRFPDVAFIGFPPIETAAVLTRWCKQRGIPTLLDTKDQWPDIFLDPLPEMMRPVGRTVLWPYFRLARRAMVDAKGISAMAEGFLDWALEIAGRERKEFDGIFPLTSPHGQVSSAELDKARQWWDMRGVVDDGRPRIFFAGAFMSIFDWQPVLEAAKMLNHNSPSCEFIICGDGGFSDELHRMMEGLANICFPGWIDRPKIEALAERCQAAIAPYLNIENFTRNIPNKIIDALSLGLPILSPLQGEVARLIDEHGVGLRYGKEAGRSLYDCIRILLQDDKLHERMSKNACALYYSRFSFENVYGGLVKHIEMIASKSNLDNTSYIFYGYKPDNRLKIDVTKYRKQLPSGYVKVIWRPKIISIAPRELLTLKFFAWWIFHWLRIFKNAHYKIILLYSSENKLANYTVILPAHYRFPFMDDMDIQIGPIETNKDHRRKGLASYAIREALLMHKKQCIWYVVRKKNSPSITLVENLNFVKIDEGIKISMKYLNFISKFYSTTNNQSI